MHEIKKVERKYFTILSVRSILLFIFSFFLLCETSAQTDTLLTDTTQKSIYYDASNARVEFFRGNNLENYIQVDTTLNLFQQYNPARKQLFPYAYLGNLGSAGYSRFFLFNRQTGFDLGRHQFDVYQFQIDSVRYFRTNTPFTSLYYLLGTKAEQMFGVTHTQNIGPLFNIALDFSRISSDGYYVNDKKIFNNVDFTSWFKTKDERYKIYGAVLYADILNTENGGIAVDSLFTTYQGPRNLAESFRSEAHTRWKKYEGQLTQTFDIGKKINYSIDDTTTAKYFSPLVQLKYQFGAARYMYGFKDPSFDQSYYPVIYEPADTIKDTSIISGYYNRFSIGNSSFKRITKDSTVKNNFLWEAYSLQQYYLLNDPSGQYPFNYFITGLNINGNILPGSALHFGMHADNDFKNNNRSASLNILYKQKFIEPELFVQYQKLSPTVMQNHYFGYTQRWDNSFADIIHYQYQLSVNIPRWKLNISATRHTFTNYILNFYDSPPLQSTDKTTVQQVVLEKNFVLGKFHINNRIAYQYTPDYYIHIPTWLTNNSFYYETYLFKSALFMQAGFDVWYSSNYYGDAYNIVTGIFYTQFTDALKFYPVADIYFNFRIKTFRFFVKLDNATQGLFENGYYEAPTYPMQYRSFKFGINWYLFY